MKGTGLVISEDITKQTRDKRSELRNFLRDLKVKKPGLRYNLAYDKLYVEEKCFQWSEAERKVVIIEESRPVCEGGDWRALLCSVVILAGTPGAGHRVQRPISLPHKVKFT